MMATDRSLISTLPLTLAVISMIVMCVTCGKSTIQHNQRSTKTPPLSTRTYRATTADYKLCMSKCRRVDNCVSVNARYDCRNEKMTCEFLKTSMDDEAGSPQAAPGWVFLQSIGKYAYPMGSSWALAFRATGGNGESVLNAWNEDGRHDDPDENKACTTLNKPADCTTHFRSSILDNWDDIDMVLLTVHKDNEVVAALIFSAKGSDRSSWLDKSRLLMSAWNDLKSSTTTNYFSIAGLDFVYRHFYLSANHGGCDKDAGWLTVADVTSTGAPEAGQCTWDKAFPAPAVLYSPLPTKVTWQSDQVGVADFMMVSVKFSS